MHIALDKSLYARAGMSRGSLQWDMAFGRVRALWRFLSRAFLKRKGWNGKRSEPLPLEADDATVTLGFCLIALIAAVSDFGGVAVAAAGVAKIKLYLSSSARRIYALRP